MKNLIFDILNAIKTQARRIERFSIGSKSAALILSIPMVLNTTTLPISLPTVKIENQKVEIRDEKLAQVIFDNEHPDAIVLDEKQIQIVLGESNFDAELKAARSRFRNVIARERYLLSIDPGFAAKRALAQAAAARYNIPWQILEAVWQVETGKSWDRSVTSYAGATGPMQFLPSTFRKYGVDGNNDGVISIYSAYDSVYAAANLLAQNGAASGDVKRALFCYNHSTSYVNKVLSIARSIGY